MIGGGVEAPRTPQRASAAGAGVAGSERRACMRERTSVPCSLLFAPMSSSSLASAPFECRNALPSPPCSSGRVHVHRAAKRTFVPGSLD